MRKQGIHGKTNFGCLFLTLLLIVGGYVGFKFGRIYLSQYMLDRKIYEIAGDAAEDRKAKLFPSERAVADAVMEAARRHSVDITYDDIEIDREPRTISIYVTWEGDIVLPYYTYHYTFYFDHQRDFKY